MGIFSGRVVHPLSHCRYLTFRILPLSRVTPKVIGSCGHMYEVESLVAFRMKGYYMNLKVTIDFSFFSVENVSLSNSI